MDRTDSNEPNGQTESKQGFEDLDNEKNQKPKNDAGRKTYTPAENDRKFTVEDFERFINSDEKVKLQKFISACCFKLSLNGDTASQVFSQTLTDVFEAIHDGAVYESKFNGLCNTIAYRLIGNAQRKRKRENGVARKNKSENEPEITARPTRGGVSHKKFNIDSLPERKCASPEVIVCLKDAIGKLTPVEQRIFILDHAGISDKEIAERLNLSVENVRTKRCRATQRLNK